MIDVIIPTYNSHDFIIYALSSILIQLKELKMLYLKLSFDEFIKEIR